MKRIYEKWWKKDTKCFQINNYKKEWKEIGNKPILTMFTNGAKKKKGDSCFDWTMIIGYTVFNYTNFDLQKKVH